MEREGFQQDQDFIRMGIARGSRGSGRHTGRKFEFSRTYTTRLVRHCRKGRREVVVETDN